MDVVEGRPWVLFPPNDGPSSEGRSIREIIRLVFLLFGPVSVVHQEPSDGAAASLGGVRSIDLLDRGQVIGAEAG